MSNFSVSVVIPLYNKAPFIRDTLESVLSQTLAPVEIIIVDDGSTDNSLDRIADLVGARVQVISQLNAGPGTARNRGVAAATQDWVALIDGDDAWLPSHLSTFADLSAAIPSADVLVNDHYYLAYGAWPNLASENDDVRLRTWDFFASRGGVNSSCIAIRRSAYNAGQGFRSFTPGEDTEFWFRLALDHQYAKSNRKTAIYFRNTGGLMDVYDKTPATYELPELFSAFEQALSIPRYENIRHKIIHYRDCVLMRSIKLALYNGNRRTAREFIALLSPEFVKNSRMLRAISLLPGPLVKRVATIRTKILSLISPER